MSYGLLVERYLAGPEILLRAISGMSDDQLNAEPVPFRWSTRHIIHHLTDMELMDAVHMKCVIAQENPTLQGVSYEEYPPHGAYEMRDVDEEVQLIMAIRRHMGRILRACDADDFERRGEHSLYGSVTLGDLLQRATDNIPHHAKHIEENRKALSIGAIAIPFHLAHLL